MKKMNELQAQVIEFHKMFEHPIAESPAAPLEERVRFRARLVLEEALELLESCFDLGSFEKPDVHEMFENGPQGMLERARTELKDIIGLARVKVDLPAAIDALADIDYVVEGTRLEFGVNGDPIAREVHRANMTKAFPCTAVGCRNGLAQKNDTDSEACLYCKGKGATIVKRADGKTLKPADWTPPDIVGELHKQMEAPASCGLAGVLAMHPMSYPNTEEAAFKFLHEEGWLSGDSEQDQHKVKTLLEFVTNIRRIDMPSDAEYDELIAKARALPPMTDHQRAMQRLDFAYGNLAIDGKASRSAFKILATTSVDGGLGWTEEQFEAWAAGKKWSSP